MPVGICQSCQRRFVVETERSFQRTCPRCLQPLKLPGTASLGALPPPSPSSAPVSARDELGGRWLKDTPVAADALGQRLMTVLAEAADECERAEAHRQRARELRKKAMGKPAASGPTPTPDPKPATEQVRLNPSPANLQERAHAVCLQTRMTVGQARVAREQRQFRRDPLSLLPPLEYKLLPLPGTQSLPSAADTAVVDHAAAPPEPEPSLLPADSNTALYVWGYQPAESSLCRDQCAATEEAARVAREMGWEEERRGAWAKEIHLGLSLIEMLRWVVPILHRDPGVDGWSMQGSRPRQH
jgi:hypothetical protein